MASQYGTGQRLAFAMMCVGFVLCVVGAASPYWMTSEIDLSDATFGFVDDIPFFGDIVGDHSLVEVNLGVWVFCIEYTFASKSECYTLYTPRQDTDLHVVGDSDDNDDFAWIQIVRIAVAINVALSLICGFAACCRCLCASGGKTICHGVFAFCAGGCGVFAFAIMISRKEELVPEILFSDIVLEWSFYLYASGSCLMVLSSLFLCFSVPNETPSGVVMPMPMMTGVQYGQHPGVFAVPTNQYHYQGQAQFPQPMAQYPQPMAQIHQPMAKTPQPMAQFPQPMAKTPEPMAQSPEPMVQSPHPMGAEQPLDSTPPKF